MHDHCSLHDADFVLVTYRDQKNGDCMETVTLFHTDDDTMCPVCQAAALVQHLHHDKRFIDNTTVNTFFSSLGKFSCVLRRTQSTACGCLVLGDEKLCFKPSKIGTHSLCSRAAMAMHLMEIPIYTIMIIGRWLSDAFLCYIRKQVAQFSQNITKRLLHTQSSLHVQNNKQVSALDPRTRNDPNNSQMRLNVGWSQPGCRAQLALVATWW